MSKIKDDPMVKKTVEEWLNSVDYAYLNEGNYVPSVFSLNYVNFIKLVNGEQGESNKTPVVHLKMLDELAGKRTRLANLCSRGMAKTTLFGEYLVLYIALYGEIEGFGKIEGMIYVSDSMENGVKSLRKNIEYRYNNSEFLQKFIPDAKFTDAYLEFTNLDGHKLGVRMFGAKTGLRGTKIFGKRPVLAVLDDLVSDDDAKSKSTMQAIKDTVYKGVDYALDPTRRKIVFSGTPFNKNDILYEAVESGGWHVNVFPICERFPCSREDFVGAWEDRFDYDFVKGQYDLAIATGQVAAFNQELMLRITSDEERLVLDSEIQWYSRKSLLANINNFNIYITTDFATSEKTSGDYSVISVWALNSNGDWFWVDGICKRQLMDKNIDELFRLCQIYNPVSVGIEVTGQQGGFIQWIKQEQLARNIWFTLASDGNQNRPGIRPTASKLVRFNSILPLFKAGKFYFPEEVRDQPAMLELMDELRLATIEGFKSKHDDFIDTISMLGCLKTWRPSQAAEMAKDGDEIFSFPESTKPNGMDSYLA